MGLTLDQIRQQLNIPKSTSDAEVIRIAQENNIVIDFSGSTQQSAGVNTGEDLGNALNGSSQTGVSAEGDIYGGMVSFSNTAPASQTQAVVQNAGTNGTTQLGTVDKKDNKKETKLRDGIDHFTSENGRTIAYDKDGKVIFNRRARYGEAGFNEKGENYDQRMQRYFNLSDERYNQMSDEEKMELSKRYQKGIRQTAYEKAIKEGKSKEEAREAAQKAVIYDFRALCRRSGKSSEELKGIAMTLYGLRPEVAEKEIQRYVGQSLTVEDASSFSKGMVENVDLTDNPEMQKAVVKGVAEAGKAAGISDEVANAIGNAITSNKFHGRDATIEALRTQYGLSAEQANEYYANLPEETRQQIEDVTLDAISTVQTEVAADSSQSEKVRQGAADLSTEYMTYFDDADYQMQVIRNNNDYIMQNADEDMQEYYTNSLAENAYNYDLSNRDDIIRMIKEQGTEKTLEILENARKAYEEQSAQAKANSDAQRAEMERQQALQPKTDNSAQTDNRTSAKEKVSATQNIKTMVKSDGLARAVSSDSFREFKTKEKEEFINNLGKTDRKEAIQTIVENAQGFELDSLMFSGLKNDILSYLVSHPTPQNNDKLKYLQRYLSPSDKAMVREMEQENMTRAEQLQVKAEEARAENQNNPNQNRVNNPFKFGFITRN